MDSREIQMQIIRSGRKTIAIEIKPDGRVLVRVPARMPKRTVETFVEEHMDWIKVHRAKMLEKVKEQKGEPLTEEKLNELFEQSSQFIPDRVEYYAKKMGLSYGRITIRNQRTRWGSCSSKGNLNFNCQLMRLSEELIDYVVVHELCHRKEMNHSAAFWAEVEKVLPDYRERRKELKKQMLLY